VTVRERHSSVRGDRPVALITGASSGIGEVFARKLVARGYDLILVARRKDRLRTLAVTLPGHAEVLSADLASEAGLLAVERAIRDCARLELLVNNAGFGTLGRFWEADVAGQIRMHEVHVMATMRLTHAALAGMVPRGRGGVISVSSVAAFGQSAGSVSYCALRSTLRARSRFRQDAPNLPRNGCWLTLHHRDRRSAHIVHALAGERVALDRSGHGQCPGPSAALIPLRLGGG